TELLGLATPVRGNDALASRGWPNVRAYTGFAVLLTICTLLGFTIENVNARRTGRLEIVCTERCRFEGMDCLPGGMIAGRYDPGVQTIEVADPAAPGGMRAVQAPIVLGHRTVFECRADATEPVPVPER
ncbi:MAG: hypothetical protein M3Y87_37005, partial [Myxococcota bacterium]|nr:hypothetical protein [Myxococcota bacterium]